MKYTVRYELVVEAEDVKKLKYKLGLIENQIKMKDKKFTREIFDDRGWYIQPLEKDKLNTMEF